jgi:hypothetical protein
VGKIAELLVPAPGPLHCKAFNQRMLYSIFNMPQSGIFCDNLDAKLIILFTY